MGRVLTNNTGISVAKEQSLGVLPGSPSWKSLEPNGITNFGAEITTVARDPISQNRQRRKGTITDLDSSVEYEADLTLDSWEDFAEGFIFSNATNNDLRFLGAVVTGTGFTIPAATAAQAAKLQFNASGPTSLIQTRGYGTEANNGHKILTADVAASDTEIQVAATVAEASPPTNSILEIAGIRGSAGDLALAIASGVGTLSSGNGAGTQIDFTTLGLTVGQLIHVGGLTSATQPFSAASTNTIGFARITAIAAAALTLDKISDGLVAFDGTDDNAGGTDVQIDLLFGRFIRNVPVSSSEFNEQSFQFELASPNLFETTPPTPLANPDGFEYALGNYCNQMAWSMPLTDKSTATFGFVGTDTENPVDNGSRKTNAASAIQPTKTSAFNTSSDFARLRIQEVDETGLTTDFKNLTITFNNNVNPQKCLGILGAAFMNFGNFEVTVEGNVLFSNPRVVNAIRNNETVTMDFVLRNDDGAIGIDIPSMTLGGGGKEFPINESVQLALTGEAFADPTLNTSIGVSLFPVVPLPA